MEHTLDPAVAPVPVAPAPRWSPADLRMRKLLRLPVDAEQASVASANRLVEKSLLISASRCLLTYVVLPFLTPILGLKATMAPVLGIFLGVVAIVANVASMRRFWRADHKYRWVYTVVAIGIILAMIWLIVVDLQQIFS